MYCTGTGHPTVILVSGLGLKFTGSLVWYMVQPVLQNVTRVCSYDRAGLGFSDMGPLPRTSSRNVADLHALLHRTKIHPPYIMVGHSLGGFDVRLFADRYPSEVAGMVLVDPIVERLTSMLERKETILYAQAQICETMARRGSLQKQDPLHKCIGPDGSNSIVEDDPHLTPRVNATIDNILQKPDPWLVYLSEAASAGFISSSNRTDDTDVIREQRGYGTMPVIVLTAADTYSGSAKKAWQKGHQRIAEYSLRGLDCVIPKVGHFIQIERPSVVITAIRQVIKLTTSNRPPSCQGLDVHGAFSSPDGPIGWPVLASNHCCF